MILLTGLPNTGKSTVIKAVITMLGQRRCGGFFTSEVLNGEMERIGFETHTLSHKRFILAHVDFDSPYQVEQFKVNVKDVEEIAVQEMLNDDHEFLIIDEIGKMQLFSDKFKDAILQLSKSGKKILATISLDDTDFTKMLKADPDNTLYHLTIENRNEMPMTIVKDIMKDDELFLSKLNLSEDYHEQLRRFEYYDDRVILHSTHDTRVITKDLDGYHCTCPYYKEYGTCSHIIAIVRNNILRLSKIKF